MYNTLAVTEFKNYTRTKPTPDDSVLVKGEVTSKSQNIYYNLSIVNKVLEDEKGVDPSISIPKIATFNTNRADNVLAKPSDYRVAVNRFACPTGLIPLFLFPENPAFYTVTLTYDDGINPVTQVTKNVTYVPSAIGDPYGEYRPVYYLQEMLNYVNVAYQEAYDEMKVILGVAYAPLDRPYLTYDATTKLITMYVEEEYLQFDTYGIFMNTTLFEGFFSGLYAREATNNVLGQFSAFQIIPQNLFTNVDLNTTLPPPNGGAINLYKVVEEFSSTPLFNQLDRLVLTSTALPISTQLLGTQRDKRANILLDFILPDDQLTKQKYEYEANTPQWVDLNAHTPMTQIDLQVYLVYNDGQIIPLYIQGSSRIDITLLFCPKGQLYR
jgi:hypothetical protein